MPHAKQSSTGNMHGGRPRNSLRSNSLGRLSTVCIQATLTRMSHVSLGHLSHPRPAISFGDASDRDMQRFCAVPSQAWINCLSRDRVCQEKSSRWQGNIALLQ